MMFARKQGMSDFSQVTVDQVRSYWDQRPCNIRHSAKPVGTREYFDEVEARKYFVEPHIPRFAEFERWQGKKVLEIGCGIGTDTVNFARCGAMVTAVDLSPQSLDLARQRVRVYGLEDRVRFYSGSAEELNTFLPVETYDLIYSFGVIHHTPHPERVVQQMRSYAKPGTAIKLMVYYRRSWKVFWLLMGYGKGQFWRLKEFVAEHSEAQTGCPVTYTYTREEGRRLIESSGFHLTDAFVDHIFPYRIPEYVKYEYVKSWPWSWTPPAVFRSMERRLGWHLCLTAEAGA
jgi:2-polyprenyl-3-methyl-5-hydroxy-6-metoxy-1,4-benzoquinol methylase